MSMTGQSAEGRGSRFGSTAASFLLPAAAVVAFLFLLIWVKNGTQAAVAGFTDLLPLGYAFAAGMVASVNPCGFFLLPSYISYQLGSEEGGSEAAPRWRRMVRALVLGSVATAGFIVVFGSVGAIVATWGRPLIAGFPYLGLGMGVAMAALGLWLVVTRSTMGIVGASRLIVAPRKNVRNVFLFGLGYAIGSLSCTLPVFLVVVGSALATRGLISSFGQFIGYALGMGAVLMSVTISTALFKDAVTKNLRSALPHIQRMSALFLLGAGAYLIYYWLFYADFFF